MDMKVGIGTDLHAIQADRLLWLGGVQIESPFGLMGHSDADVVLHAVIDALLGAAGLGDIGEWFPDNDDRWKNADSKALCSRVFDAVCERGWAVQNLDVVISAEKPRLGQSKQQIRASLSRLLNVPITSINIKAKTNEGFDAIGRGEAIGCQAIVLLKATQGDKLQS